MTRSARSSQGRARPRTNADGRPAFGSRSGAGRSGASRSGSSRGSGSRGSAPRDTASPADIRPTVPSRPSRPPVDSFAELDMPAALHTALARQGVTVPFPIQGATLPDSLDGRDVLGRGRTGSGKTLAFGLALLARIAGERAQPRTPLALVLVPTRELAQQVTEALTPYANAVGLRAATVVGGMSIGRQASALNRGAELVVATPGRLADLINRGDCRLDQVRITVLDEADQMADMGFLPQVTALLAQVAPEGQRMLFSATLDRNVDRLVRRFLNDPVTHSVDPSEATVTTMEHHVLHVEDGDKNAVTTHIAARDGRVLMFLHTKHAANRLTKQLLASGVHAAALHGGKSQSQRNRTLEQFRDGHVSVLVATNVAARGIHIDNLDLVVNVDPPADHKDYLHRAGRTARAGESGTVVTLVLANQRREMSRLMQTAAIIANSARVRSGGDELARITGARVPSGVPVTVAAPAPAPSANRSRPRSGGGGAAAVSAGSRGRRGRPSQQGRTTAPSRNRSGGRAGGGRTAGGRPSGGREGRAA